MSYSQILMRRGLAATWTTDNPVLGEGEPGWEIDTNKMKIGDGQTRWTSLAYFAGTSGSVLTTKGDLAGFDTAPDRVPVGTDGEVLTADSSQALGLKWAAPSGTSGQRRTIKIPFAYNTPGILTGAALYTPTIGDILHDAWIKIVTAWDGTTPIGDFGDFTGSGGWMGATLTGGQDMTRVDDTGWFNHVLLTGESIPSLAGLSAVVLSEFYYTVSGSSLVAASNNPAQAVRPMPAEFGAATPIKVCVSQTGQTNGADPGSTQGAAFLFLDISTPVAP